MGLRKLVMVLKFHILGITVFKFSFGEVYRRIYGRKFGLTATRK